MSEDQYQENDGGVTEFGGEPKTLRYAIHFEQLANDQLKKIAEAKMSGDESLIYYAVSQLENILETEAKTKIRTQREEGKYSLAETRWVAKGTMSEDPLNPALTNIPGTTIYNPDYIGVRYELKEDGDSDNPDDWVKVRERGGIHWMSPTPQERGGTDFDQWISDMVDEFQAANAAWRGVNRARVLGRLPQRDKAPHPFLVPLPQQPLKSNGETPPNPTE
jgi:hypothetical protein